MERGLLLDVVVGERTPVFQLFSCENEPLLVWRDPLLVLDLSLDVVNGIRCFDVQSDGLASKRLHKDLHTSTQAKHQMERGLLLDVLASKRLHKDLHTSTQAKHQME